MRRLGILVAGSLAFWIALAYPARLWGGDGALVCSGAAAALCLVPTAATLVWSQRALRGSPNYQALAVLGGTGVRMAFVLGAGLALFYLVQALHTSAFWIWVVVFYLFTLTLEMALLLVRPAPADPSQPADEGPAGRLIR